MASYWGKQAAGILVIAKDTKRFLLLQRAGWVHQPLTWGIPGGAIHRGESPRQGAIREAEEELGENEIRVGKSPLFVWQAPDSTFRYSTFLGSVPHEFEPDLSNDEHIDFHWVDLPSWLAHDDLHPGIEDLLRLAMPAILEALL